MIRLLLKLSDESLGVAFSRTGGKLSRGPPVGGIMFAQPGAVMNRLYKTAIIKKLEINRFIGCKLRKLQPLHAGGMAADSLFFF